MPKRRSSVTALSRLPRRLLHIELSLTVLQALAVLLSYLYVRVHDPLCALTLYPRLLPHLFFPLLIAIFTVLLSARLVEECEGG